MMQHIIKLIVATSTMGVIWKLNKDDRKQSRKEKMEFYNILPIKYWSEK